MASVGTFSCHLVLSFFRRGDLCGLLRVRAAHLASLILSPVLGVAFQAASWHANVAACTRRSGNPKGLPSLEVHLAPGNMEVSHLIVSIRSIVMDAVLGPDALDLRDRSEALIQTLTRFYFLG